MSAQIFESVTRLTVASWRIRVWREESALGAATRDDLRALRDSITRDIVMGSDIPSGAEILALFAPLERVTAVEVSDPDGNANLVYNDWP